MSTSEFSFRWGIPWLDVGFVGVPNFFFGHYVDLGVTRIEFLLVLHLARYRFESSGGVARPSLQRVSAEMGLSRRQVQRVVKGLEDKGWLAVTERPGLASEYNFEALARALLRRESERGGGEVDVIPKNLRGDMDVIPKNPRDDMGVQGTLDMGVTRIRKDNKEKAGQESGSSSSLSDRVRGAVDRLMVNGYGERMARGMVMEFGADRVVELLDEWERGEVSGSGGDWIRRELARGVV